MRILRTLSDGETERVLSGRATADQPELTRFLADLRVAYGEGPASSTAAAHLAAIARATADVASVNGSHTLADESVVATARPPRRRRAIPRRRLAMIAAAVALAVPSTSAALAFAGVSLPGVARAPFDKLGVDLPNQASSDDVQAVIESTPTDQRGCAFGQAVARAASGKPGPGTDPCTRRADHNDGNSNASSDGKSHAAAAANAGAGQSFGAQTSQNAQQSASQDGRSFGQTTSQGAQQLGQQQTASGQQTGEQHSATGQATGEQNSATGQATGEQHASAGQSGAHGP